ncbi:arginase [Profundibacter amoris]|uniref:Arginase n=1 Tax=Profundibacter amoris TaxID=2171755 RepID=A0A347UGM8_9RHOB|nr:arginase [Profundibacter amoris]AXX98006.1 arginase [Profundibacter amoris]
MRNITLIGAPVDSGKRRRGCLMGPDAMRTAGLEQAITGLGHSITDIGNLAPARVDIPEDDNIHALAETVGWTQTLMQAAQNAMTDSLPIFLGGDHALSLGSVAGVAAHAAQVDRPLFVLWLDAHSDFHTPKTTASGNLHGTPLGYVTGLPGFDAFPPLPAIVPMNNICLIGLRSVDPAEQAALVENNIRSVDMRAIDEGGIKRPLEAFLDDVSRANGLLHVSLDVDFLDPAIAPAVGTTVPGGATFREAHLVMEMLHDSGLVTSLDLVELNPFLDDRGQTAKLMVDLTASLLGRRVFDRPTRSY